MKHGESWTNMRFTVLLFSLFESESWPRKNKSAWWIFTKLYFHGGESRPNYLGKEVNWWMMVNPDLTILLQRWTEVKTWGGEVQDALWRVHKKGQAMSSVAMGNFEPWLTDRGTLLCVLRYFKSNETRLLWNFSKKNCS